jgi:hypothetical protein
MPAQEYLDHVRSTWGFSLWCHESSRRTHLMGLGGLASWCLKVGFALDCTAVDAVGSALAWRAWDESF